MQIGFSTNGSGETCIGKKQKQEKQKTLKEILKFVQKPA